MTTLPIERLEDAGSLIKRARELLAKKPSNMLTGEPELLYILNPTEVMVREVMESGLSAKHRPAWVSWESEIPKSERTEDNSRELLPFESLVIRSYQNKAKASGLGRQKNRKREDYRRKLRRTEEQIRSGRFMIDRGELTERDLKDFLGLYRKSVVERMDFGVEIANMNYIDATTKLNEYFRQKGELHNVREPKKLFIRDMEHGGKVIGGVVLELYPHWNEPNRGVILKDTYAAWSYESQYEGLNLTIRAHHETLMYGRDVLGAKTFSYGSDSSLIGLGSNEPGLLKAKANMGLKPFLWNLSDRNATVLAVTINPEKLGPHGFWEFENPYDVKSPLRVNFVGKTMESQGVPWGYEAVYYDYRGNKITREQSIAFEIEDPFIKD